MTLKAVAITGGGGGGGISGSGSSPYVAVWSGTSAITTGSLVDTGSRVGILQTSPVTTFQVGGNTVATASPVGAFCTLGSNSRFTADDGTRAVTLAANGTDAIVGTTTAHDLVLQRGGVEAARIIAGGKIGVGNTDPATLIETYGTTGIRASSDTVANVGVFQYSSDATPATLTLRKANGTRAAQAAIASTNAIGSLNFAAWGGTTGSTLSSISSNCEAYVSNSNMSTSLRFGVSPAGSAAVTETMRIMPGTAAIPIGNVGIGTTTPGTKLDIAYGDFQTIGAMRIGADIGEFSTRTSGVAKFGAITVPHFTNSEENIFLQGIHSLAGNTICYIGGGLNGFNASTSTRFYAAATNTTQAGTYIAQLTTSGISLDTAATTLTFDARTIGQGIKLPTAPGNGDLTTLDCYEEGTWTPVDRSGAALTFTAVSGSYTRIGRTVVAQCTLTYPSTANASDASFSLPIAMTTANTNFGGATIGLAGALAKNNVTALIKTGATPATDSRIALITYNGAGTVTNANMSLVTIAVSVCYNVA
jgi:hypothetical protein